MPNSIKNIYDIYKLLAGYFSKKKQKKQKKTRKKFQEKETGVLIGVFQKENMCFNFSCKLK